MTILINNPETDNKDSLEQLVLNTASTQSPWWLKVAGSMETDPTFDEAVRLGQEWRKSQQ